MRSTARVVIGVALGIVACGGAASLAVRDGMGPRPVLPARPMVTGSVSGPVAAVAPRPAAPLTSAAARFAVEPPPPIIKPKAAEPAPPVVPRTADQIFTF